MRLYARINGVETPISIGGGGGQTIQVDILPTASATEEGNIYQYIGATGNGLTTGFFYQCQEDTDNPGSYIWVELTVSQGGSNAVPSSVDILSSDPVDPEPGYMWIVSTS